MQNDEQKIGKDSIEYALLTRHNTGRERYSRLCWLYQDTTCIFHLNLVKQMIFST